MLHVAIDLGAGSGRAFVGGLVTGGLRLQEVHRFHYEARTSQGRLRWDAARLFDGLRTGLRSARALAQAESSRLDSVGVDSWAVDYGLLDADGRLLEEPVCYRDARTDGVMEQVFASVPREEIFARTGIQFLKLNTLYQLAAHVRDGIPSGAARLLLVPDLCHHFLCGSLVSERTNASTTQLLNARTGLWDDAL
jgi:rhamnulokinase